MTKIKLTGKGLVFANYFGKQIDGKTEYAFDIPREERYSDKYSLQTEQGLKTRTEYLAKTHQLGYIQTGNMDLAVWQSKTKDEVLIVEENDLGYYDEAYDENEKKNKPFCDAYTKKEKSFKEKYKRIGEISCSVWRVEFIDEALVTPEITDYNSAYNKKDRLIAKLPKGEYELTENEMTNDPQPFCTWMTIKKVA